MNVAVSGVDKIRKALEIKRSLDLQPAGVLPVDSTPEREDLPAGARAEPRTLAVDPALLRSHRVLVPGDAGPATQAYKMLRTQVLQMLRRHGYTSLAIISPAAGDGRTMTAINLAASIAEEADHTCLLVDMDLKRPGVRDRFGISVERGTERWLAGEADVADLLVRPAGFGRLVLLPAARPVTSSAELLAADSTRRLTREVNRRYANRIVVYDLPAMLESADALAFLPCVDAALIVVQEGRTRRDDIVRCLHLMHDTPVVGTMLNGSRESRGL